MTTKAKVLIVTVIVIITGVLMFFVGRDLGSTEMKEYVLHNQEIYQTDNYYVVDIDGELHNYYKD